MQRLATSVATVLAEDIAARECDNRLILLVCQKMGHALTQQQVEFIESLPKFSSIVRSRARIQAGGRFRPRPEVWEKRSNHKRS